TPPRDPDRSRTPLGERGGRTPVRSPCFFASGCGVPSQPAGPATLPVTRPRCVVIAVASLPLRSASQGPDAAARPRRLAAAGVPADGAPGALGGSTAEAARAFQPKAGLDPDGSCGPSTWSALSEAGYGLGDRLLCLPSPVMRGDDVSELQLR